MFSVGIDVVTDVTSGNNNFNNCYQPGSLLPHWWSPLCPPPGDNGHSQRWHFEITDITILCWDGPELIADYTTMIQY